MGINYELTVQKNHINHKGKTEKKKKKIYIYIYTLVITGHSYREKIILQTILQCFKYTIENKKSNEPSRVNFFPI